MSLHSFKAMTCVGLLVNRRKVERVVGLLIAVNPKNKSRSGDRPVSIVIRLKEWMTEKLWFVSRQG